MASQMSGMLSTVIAAVQVVVAVGLFSLFDYDDVSAFTTQKYIIFRDIMVMLLLGFGYCKSTKVLISVLIYFSPYRAVSFNKKCSDCS